MLLPNACRPSIPASCRRRLLPDWAVRSLQCQPRHTLDQGQTKQLNTDNIKGQQVKDANLTITVNRSDLELVMGKQVTFDQLREQGKAKFEGDRKPFDQLMGAMVAFSPDFEMLPLSE